MAQYGIAKKRRKNRRFRHEPVNPANLFLLLFAKLANFEWFKFNSSFHGPEGPQAKTILVDIYFMIYILNWRMVVYNSDRYMVFQFGSEPVLIQRI